MAVFIFLLFFCGFFLLLKRKRPITYFLVLLSFLVLTACSSAESDQVPMKQPRKEHKQTETKSSSKEKTTRTENQNQTKSMNKGRSESNTSSQKPKVPPSLIPAVVSKNVDGDTIHVKMPSGKNEDIRMLLIDTPEDVSPSKPVEPYGYTAAHYATKVLPVGKHIYIEKGVSGYTRDKYGRMLAYIYISPEDMYNIDVVKKGYARVAYVYPPNTKHLKTLRTAQAYAKGHHLGIWSISNYVSTTGYDLNIACQYAAVHHYGTTGCSRNQPTQSTDSGSSGSIHSSSSNFTVRRGSEASVSIKTEPYAKGSIEVDYKSGPSHAKGLDPKQADSKGVISWSWFIGTSTTPGTYNVIIEVKGKTYMKHLTVTN